MGEYINKKDIIRQLCLTTGCSYHDEVVRTIMDFPAEDVQPVKHGRWENPVSVGNGIKFCSVCRNEAYWDTDYGQQLFDYCPYCGARMIKDGDTE